MSDEFKVIMLSWEFPPRIIGGIAAHVHDLALALHQLGISVDVVTCDFPDTKSYEELEGIRIHRVDSYKFPTSNFASWVFMMNINMQKYTAELLKEQRKEAKVLLHCHDWLVANSAVGLKYLFRRPLLATIHSTEHGRRNGIHSDYQNMIHQTEGWLSHESWRVICCSKYMADQVSNIFSLSDDKIDTIANGVSIDNYVKAPLQSLRNRFAKDDEKVVLYVGRLVFEKGVSVLLDAVKHVLQRVNTKFIIVGEGYMKERLMAQAHHLGISHKVFFTGFLDGNMVKSLYQVADVFVVPSLYEPFGIVALEAMASRAPIVVSEVGGLKEIVEHDRTGVLVYPNNPVSLAWGILRILEDEDYSQWIRRNGYNETVTKYNWNTIAEQTKKVYMRILFEYEAGEWKPT